MQEAGVPINLGLDLQQLSGTLIAIISILSAVGIAIWIALTIWTFRDMKARSRDTFGQILAALVVAVLNIPGFLVYLILRPRETLAEQYERALEEEALLQEIENRLVCPGCGHATKDNWRICPYCHTKLKKQCTNCGELLDLPWKICPYCEIPQMEESRPARQQRSQTYVPSFDDMGGES
jgi:RNA polymerase subunit RPABC4/transcription elongation factor Spt4